MNKHINKYTIFICFVLILFLIFPQSIIQNSTGVIATIIEIVVLIVFAARNKYYALAICLLVIFVRGLHSVVEGITWTDYDKNVVKNLVGEFLGDSSRYTGTIPQNIANAIRSRISAGPTGPAGPTGAVGPKGDKGDKGSNGDKGPTGSQGIQGNKGEKGDKGDAGISNLPGPIGATGPTGAQGIQGITGPQGEKGVQGPIGLTGAQGIQGVQGIAGPQGIQGIQGPTGPTGPVGAPGPKGTSPQYSEFSAH